MTPLSGQLAPRFVQQERLGNSGGDFAAHRRASTYGKARAMIPSLRQSPLTCKGKLPFVATGFLLTSLLVAGCGSSISRVNGKPDQYYGKMLSLHGRVGEIIGGSDTGEATVFHLVSKGGHRIITVAVPPVAFRVGDQIYVRGEFVNERTVAGRTYYDVVSAATIRKASVWSWIPFR